ncbi:MAG: DUF3179 domain-containing protein [Pseudomonadota bacterium]
MRVLTLAAAICMAAASAFAQVEFWKNVWSTNFENSSVDFIDIMSGGPGKDGIPAIDDPKFIGIGAEGRLNDREPVMTVEINGDARAYPIRYLMWHEIVNDTVGGTPVSVTYCPLCNSGIIFDRRVNGDVITLGVSGMLRNSDMIMYDRQTETWWQQFTGEAIVGDLLGAKLVKLPGWMESWASFKARNPRGLVMDEPDFARRYGTNPYRGYDSAARPFLFNGEMPPHGIEPLLRVVVVEDRAWPLTRFTEGTPVITEAGIEITWEAGKASPLDTARIYQGRDVGQIRVRDAATGQDLPHDVAFAFAFHAFHPDGTWMLGDI